LLRIDSTGVSEEVDVVASTVVDATGGVEAEDAATVVTGLLSVVEPESPAHPARATNAHNTVTCPLICVTVSDSI
jgi:hypothetical protein